MTRLLETQNLELSFGSNRVLDGLGFRVNRGEAVGVVGPNGAGKTTLLKIVAGLLDPDAGTVRLSGDRLEGLSRRDIARRLAVVPQATPQVFNYSVLQFVLMGHYARSRRLVPTDRQIQRGIEALERVEMKQFADRNVSRLSGGEMQRALVARALVADAPLWLLDEPTANLDMRYRTMVLERIREHADDGGAAVAVVHDLELVHRFFDRVAALCDGRFIADGAPDEVLTPSLVSEMYGVPMRRGCVDGHVVWITADE